MRVGLIGLGHVGLEVAKAIAAGEAGGCRLAGALVRRPAAVHPDAAALGMPIVSSLEELFATEPVVVVELAGHEGLRAHGEAVLRSGRDLVTISVGALADAGLRERILAAARESGRQVLVPSGAIAGLDAIGAAALGGLDTVVHTTRKPVAAFTEAQLGGPRPSEATELFDGPAAEGVLRFPENVNVAAAVSLAGIGFDRTRLRVIADPAISRNRHEVDVAGYFGTLRIEIENIPTANPKTGRIVSLSVVKALRDLTAPIVLGR